MDNLKQDVGKVMIKRIALTAIYFYKKGFMIEASGCSGDVRGMDIAYDALKNACDHANVNYGDVYHNVVAR